jgi:hypothetical protein
MESDTMDTTTCQSPAEVDRWTTHDKIIEDHPLLYHNCSFLEIGPGWYSLVSDLSSKIEAILEHQAQACCYAVQVKEKYGTLRFIMALETEEISKLIAQYEELSSKTCEKCGAPGKLYDSGWFSTRCEEHRPTWK